MRSETIIVGAGTEYPLHGLLTLPDDLTAPVPGVVMVHGSGPSNMDEKLMKLTPFKDLAEGLAKHGVAALRYDKRTFTYARKLAKADATVQEETIEDALRAIELLKNDPRIDRARVFLLGHSMGAMLAPRIDAQGGNVRGLVMLAGTPNRMEDIMLRQLRQASGGNFLLKGIVALEYRIFSKKFNGLYEMSDEEAKKKKFASKISLYYFKDAGRKSAADYLLESDKPALLLQGGRDFQVLADEDFKQFQTLLAGRPNTVFKLYPNLNHLFVDALCDNIMQVTKEYGTPRHITDEVIGDIAAFVKGAPLQTQGEDR